MSKYQQQDSVVVSRDPVIVSVGRSERQAFKLNKAREEGYDVIPCKFYVMLAKDDNEALENLKKQLPTVYQTMCDEVQTEEPEIVLEALRDSWGPYSVAVIGNGGSSGFGWTTLNWAYEGLLPEHRELIARTLLEVYDV